MGNSASEYPSSDSPVTGSSSNEKGYPQKSRDDEFRELNANLPAEFSSKYQAVSKIGSGSFGSVYKVRDHKTKAIYAAKMVDLHHHNTQSEVKYCRCYKQHSGHLYAFMTKSANSTCK